MNNNLLHKLYNIYSKRGIIWTKVLAKDTRKFIENYNLNEDNINNSDKFVYDIIMYLFDKYMEVPEAFCTLNDYYRFITSISPDFFHDSGLEYSDFI